MTTAKRQLLALKRLSDDASIAEQVAAFHNAASIPAGPGDIEHGRVLPHEAVKARLIARFGTAGRFPFIRPKDQPQCALR